MIRVWTIYLQKWRNDSFFYTFAFFWVRRTPHYKVTHGMDNFQDITMTEHVLESWKNVEKYKFSCIYMYVTIFAQWVRKRNFFIFLHPENMFLVNKMSTIRVRDPQTSIIWSFLHAWASGTVVGGLKVIWRSFHDHLRSFYAIFQYPTLQCHPLNGQFSR